jgi:spoIIIJ-associated protein
VQWIETTGRTIEDAKESALDQLGIDESEAEFEVIEEPKTGLFGRVRADARIRARVAPKAPRPKHERRPRKQRGRSDKGSGGGGSQPANAAGGRGGEGGDRPARSGNGGGNNRNRQRSNGGSSARTKQEGSEMTDDIVPVGAQADIITEFLEGLLVAMKATGTVRRTQVDDETIELSVEGDDLGLLIGPKGQTLTAVHELSRTVLQRRATGHHEGRVRIDIGGYRQRRAEALARFVTAQAELVVSEGKARSLEPMNAADRKVVHDTVNDIAGVGTISEGADPDRRVVLVPEATEE